MKKIATMNGFLDLFPYGASELRRVFERYLLTALLISVAFHFLLLGSYFLAGYLQRQAEPPMDRVVRLVKYTDLGPPPSISEEAAPPAVAVSLPVARPTIGVPVPVKDDQISEETTIATQSEMATAPVLSMGMGSGDSLVVTEIPDVMPDINDFVAVEVEPVVVVQVDPVYPNVARLAEVEGTVYIKVLVDKEGKVKKAVPVEGPEIFYEEAIKASMKWVFKPALQRDKPVPVWVVIPFRFSMKG